MRIVLPYNDHLGKFSKTNFVGGIEKFCVQIMETYDDVHIINIDNKEKPKHNTDKIKMFAKEKNADIIISNWHQASFVGSSITDSEIPIMFVYHALPSFNSMLNNVYNLKRMNHSCFFVSEYQLSIINEMAKRFKTDKIEADGFINSSFVRGDKPKLNDIEYDCITIGRCEPTEKKPFLLKEYLKDTDYKSMLITTHPRSDKERKYIDKNSDWDNVLMGIEHSKAMEHLSKSMTYFSTMPFETWGITALEALSHGVPIILNAKKMKHSSESIPASKRHYKNILWDKKVGSEQLISAIESFRNMDRKEIQDMTWDKHSHSEWERNFSNCIDKTLDNFKKNNKFEKFT